MTGKEHYEENVLPGEIKQYGDFQVFDLHGRDARGFDFGVRLTPVQALPLMAEAPQAVDADRVFMYAGGDYTKIDELNSEIEIVMGDEPEVYAIEKSVMTYVPKGTVYGQTVTRKSDETAWVLMLTLPPRYDPPEKPESKVE